VTKMYFVDIVNTTVLDLQSLVQYLMNLKEETSK
jgi:hypothetical protein